MPDIRFSILIFRERTSADCAEIDRPRVKGSREDRFVSRFNETGGLPEILSPPRRMVSSASLTSFAALTATSASSATRNLRHLPRERIAVDVHGKADRGPVPESAADCFVGKGVGIDRAHTVVPGGQELREPIGGTLASSGQGDPITVEQPWPSSVGTRPDVVLGPTSMRPPLQTKRITTLAPSSARASVPGSKVFSPSSSCTERKYRPSGAWTPPGPR